MSPHLEVTADAAELGLDPSRLDRLKAHFDRYVANEVLPGYLISVAREGEVAAVLEGGMANRETGQPITSDNLWRIYSMTKPITTVALMSLYEEGRFDLNDEVARYLPAFGDTRVYVGGPAIAPLTEPQLAPMRIWHLLSHTAGLTYGFDYLHPTDQIYRDAGFDFGTPREITLAEATDRFASFPLRFQPGTAFNYSVATDVVGRLIEVLTDQPLDQVLEERVFAPLGMVDTGFFAKEEDHERVAELYLNLGGGLHPGGPMSKGAFRAPWMLSGGGGLVSSAHDYHRFTTMLLAGGVLDGVRILSSRTLALMVANHLPEAQSLAEAAVDGYAEVHNEGVGFGLGFATVIDQLASKTLTSEGSFYWGGAASTMFWVDPLEGLTVQFFTQLLPSGDHQFRRELTQLSYQALID